MECTMTVILFWAKLPTATFICYQYTKNGRLFMLTVSNVIFARFVATSLLNMEYSILLFDNNAISWGQHPTVTYAQRNLSEILSNQTEIRLYLPFSD